MRNLIFLSLGFFAQAALGLRYESGMDVSLWVTDSSPFTCRLEHYIEGYGTGAFVHHAGEARELALDGQGIDFGGDRIEIRARPPSWKPGTISIPLGQLKPHAGTLTVSDALATDIASELLSGMMVSFSGELQDSREQPLEVFLSTVGFRGAFDKFTACEDQLLSASFHQIERSRIQYDTGLSELDATARRLLEKIARFLAVDETVQQIFIDGHTDDSGLTKDNIVLSRQRAERVRDFLLGQGVPEPMMVVRYHAEKYPVVKNTTPANRAKNRRTTIRLSREYEPQPERASDSESQSGGTDPGQPPTETVGVQS